MVRYDAVESRRRYDQRKAAPAEFGGITRRNCTLGDLYHYPIHLRFLKIWRAETVLDIESIHAQEQNIRIQAAQGFFCDWAYQRK